MLATLTWLLESQEKKRKEEAKRCLLKDAITRNTPAAKTKKLKGTSHLLEDEKIRHIFLGLAQPIPDKELSSATATHYNITAIDTGDFEFNKDVGILHLPNQLIHKTI